MRSLSLPPCAPCSGAVALFLFLAQTVVTDLYCAPCCACAALAHHPLSPPARALLVRHFFVLSCKPTCLCCRAKPQCNRPERPCLLDVDRSRFPIARFILDQWTRAVLTQSRFYRACIMCRGVILVWFLFVWCSMS